ncbi:hypothetical protein C2G38_2180518 [Gigaspora rosea]|uniref:Uncharacterized protein n=1 Tax=Gigaspora rosea TaxID=44941 RepID=A0A397VD50_9GLOM|nr:hypothetical protein C2G38_2180518 [Gigaspora rosea]
MPDTHGMLNSGQVNYIYGHLRSLPYWTSLKRLDLVGIKPQVYGLEYLAHNSFIGINGFMSRIRQVKERAKSRIRQVKERAKPRIRQVKERAKPRIRQVKKEQSQKIDKLKREQDQELDKLKKEQSQELDKLKRELEQELDKLKKEQSQELDKLKKEQNKLKQQLQEFSNLLFPNQSYDFTQLKQEIIRLKYQELAPQVRKKKKEQLSQLVNNAKTKTDNLGNIIDLLLKTQRQISKTKPGSNERYRVEGQLTAYQNLLEYNLTKEELQHLLNEQTELFQLEEHLASLQINEVFNPQ